MFLQSQKLASQVLLEVLISGLTQLMRTRLVVTDIVVIAYRQIDYLLCIGHIVSAEAVGC